MNNKPSKWLIWAILLMLSIPVLAQDPPPPPPPNGGQGGNQAGGAAPIGSGLASLIGLSLAYGLKKTYNYKTKN